jgi:hypothetical protein
VLFVRAVSPATKSKSYPKANRQRCPKDTKCVWKFPSAVVAGIRPIFTGGNDGRGRFQSCRPRHWPCFCMVLTLFIHRQLTSLAEIFDGLAQGLHKFLPANCGGTLDKLRFYGNKSLQRKNDLRETALAAASARESRIGGISPLPSTRRRPYFDSCFSSSFAEFGRKFCRSGISRAQYYTGEIRAKPLTNEVFQVINPYHDKNDDHDPDQQTPDGVSAGVV